MRISLRTARHLFSAATLVITGACFNLASANVITYSTRADFLAATSSTSTIDFSGIATAGNAVSYTTSAGTTISGVQFVGTTDTGFQTYVIDDTFCCATYTRGQPASLSGPVSSNGPHPRTVITLPGSITAIGMDLFTVTVGDGAGSLTDTVVFTINGNNYSVPTALAPNRVFFGFTSDAPISTFSVAPTRADTAVDLAFFTTGTAIVSSAAPEPKTYILALCFAGLVFARRRLVA